MDIVCKKSSINNNNSKKNKFSTSQVDSGKQEPTIMGFISLKSKNTIKEGNYPINKSLTPSKYNNQEETSFIFKEIQINHQLSKITKKCEVAISKNESFTNTKHSYNGKGSKRKN